MNLLQENYLETSTTTHNYIQTLYEHTYTH